MDQPPNESDGSFLTWRNLILAAAIFGAISVVVYLWLPEPESAEETIDISQVITDARAGDVERILVDGDRLTVQYVAASGTPAVSQESTLAETVDLPDLLRSEGIAISGEGSDARPAVSLEYAEQDSSSFGLFSLLINILPLILVAGFFVLLVRRRSAPQAEATRFGKSGARLIAPTATGVTLADVAGVDEAKEELAEVVDFLQNPARFAELGARIPRGILLLGPPGTGKTLLARAVAGEAGVPFFSISASEFVEMFVGVGASRVRDLFSEAKKQAPCIVFLDEIDAVGRQRGAGVGGAHDEREQTLNQILVEMDGFEPGTNVVVLAATNRPDILDAALVRPGRFDRKVVLDPPDLRGREAILAVHLRGKPLDDDVSAETLAKSTPGFTGADLANMVNEAAILATRRHAHEISAGDFAEAVERVLAGPERKSRLLSEKERRIVAVHEGAHAVVAHFLAHHDRPQKVTIISRGTAAGYTRFLPDGEDHFKTLEVFTDQLTAELAGHAAEELVFGSASTGPANDIEQATRLARAMVTRWGMSEAVGPLFLAGGEEQLAWYREGISQGFSEETSKAIDGEVRRLIVGARARAMEILSQHRGLLDAVASRLLEIETLQDPELGELLESGESATRSSSPDSARAAIITE